mmetsp:Transcript_44000/g.102680  ORF Transcript_44000/g.102680 Transcript_44000/m.102680 type:complete len:240 (+) Transcript_44000:661-1380(+)
MHDAVGEIKLVVLRGLMQGLLFDISQPQVSCRALRADCEKHRRASALLLRCFLPPTVFDPEIDRLGHQHNGNCEKADHHESSGNRLAEHAIRIIGERCHRDHRVDDARGWVHRGDPLIQNHVVHVAEQAEHEEDHRQTLADEVHLAALVNGISCSQQQAGHHLCHTEKHRNLHLQRIHVHQLILRPMPSRIHSERVRSSASRVPGVVKWLQLDLRSGPPLRNRPARWEEAQADAEEVIV